MKTKMKIIYLVTFITVIFTTSNLSAQSSDIISMVKNNDLNGANELINAGADLNTKDDMMGYTPLIIAANNGNKEMAELLLSKGADINAQDTRMGYTALMWALNGNNEDLAKFLIDNGADFKIKANDGTTALILACGVSPEISKSLLSKGANINARTDKGLGVFSQCITMGMMRGNEKITPEFAEFLLSEGASINEKNTVGGYKGYTPLFWAILYDETDVVKFLAEKGADVNAVAENGKTPLSIASEGGNEDIVALLKNHGAK